LILKYGDIPIFREKTCPLSMYVRGKSKDNNTNRKVKRFFTVHNTTMYHRLKRTRRKRPICKDPTVKINFIPPIFLVWYGWYS
jgi:hypothetical protein